MNTIYWLYLIGLFGPSLAYFIYAFIRVIVKGQEWSREEQKREEEKKSNNKTYSERDVFEVFIILIFLMLSISSLEVLIFRTSGSLSQIGWHSLINLYLLNLDGLLLWVALASDDFASKILLCDYKKWWQIRKFKRSPLCRDIHQQINNLKKLLALLDSERKKLPQGNDNVEIREFLQQCKAGSINIEAKISRLREQLNNLIQEHLRANASNSSRQSIIRGQVLLSEVETRINEATSVEKQTEAAINEYKRLLNGGN